MNRRLLLIMSSGGAGSILQGVSQDKMNYLRFFKLPEGGFWQDNEITVFDQGDFSLANIRLLKEEANRSNQSIDYFLIVYGGHGFTSPNGTIYFEVATDRSISIDEILQEVGNTRCLFIADSCRTVAQLHEGGRLTQQRLFSETPPEARYFGELCRDYYNELIVKVPLNHTIVFADAYNESASDTPRGGLYSFELLSAARSFKDEMYAILNETGKVSEFLTIIECHNRAAIEVEKKSRNMQHPKVLQCPRSHMQFPFVVCLNWQVQL